MSVLKQCAVRAHAAVGARRAALSAAVASASSSSAAAFAYPSRHASSSSSTRKPATVQNVSSAVELPPTSGQALQQDVREDDVFFPEEPLTQMTHVVEGDRFPHLRSMVEMAHALVQSGHIEDPERAVELKQVLAEEGAKMDEGVWPVWIEQEYRSMRSVQRKAETPSDRAYQRARSLLWMPKDVGYEAAEALVEQYAQTLDEPFRSFWLYQKDIQEQLDTVLRSHWDKLGEQGQDDAMLRARYECLRRLGWRKGYTSGYPKAEDEEQAKLLEQIRTGNTSQRQSALSALAKAEEDEAWQAFQDASPSARRQEEQLAWRMRDRSLLYIDDASSSYVADTKCSRWFAAPQRVGAMTFLPNDIIRLVRNTTLRNARYDAFKATFRVPLSMHKHALRSYLLAIYGLRTTWCRSMIYRAAIKRNRLGQKQVGPSQRTFKKVEVGLLEPFVFPEMTEAFVRKHFMLDELESQVVSQTFKFSRRQRWRSQRMPTGVKIDKNSAAIDEPDVQGQTFDRLSTLTGGIPTKRHSRILKMLNDKRRLHDALVAAKAGQLQRQNAQDGNDSAA